MLINNTALLDKLQEKLDQDLSWRKKEITNLLLHIETQHGEIQISLIRGAITLLYAHWEGFIKKAAVLYLKYICNLKLTLSSLSDNFCYITLGQKFPQNETSMKSYDCQKKIFEYIQLHHHQEILKIDPASTIKTHGNLTFENFATICQQIGIDISWYITKQHLLDERLLGLRNPIAHGEFRTHTKILEDFKEIKIEILSFLEQFKDLIVDASETQKFLR